MNLFDMLRSAWARISSRTTQQGAGSYVYDPVKVYEDYLARLPDDGRSRLDEPLPEQLKPDPTVGRTTLQCELPAEDPDSSEARFLGFLNIPAQLATHGSQFQSQWINATQANQFMGGGIGFYNVTERPVVKTQWHSRLQAPEIWSLGSFFVASRNVADVVQRYAAEETRIIDAELENAAGDRIEGYVLLDIVKRRHAFDYRRSDVEVFLSDGRRYLRVGRRRSLRADIPATTHAFRDALEAGSIFFSRELAVELEKHSAGLMWFTDPHLGVQSPLTLDRIRTAWRKYAVADSGPAQPAIDRMLQDALSFVQEGELKKAEDLLAESLRSLKPTPYHAACDLNFTSSAQEVAGYFNDFVKKARREGKLAAIYSEMNAFTVNPHLWFFDVFGFSLDGGRDNFDWLGDFDSHMNESFVMEGLEPLQQAFDEAMWLQDADLRFRDARHLAKGLVIVKFQRLLSSARRLMTTSDTPLLASAHDYSQYITEIR